LDPKFIDEVGVTDVRLVFPPNLIRAAEEIELDLVLGYTHGPRPIFPDFRVSSRS